MAKWSKIPLLLFESSSMGWKFMLVTLALSLIGIMVIAHVMEKALSSEEKTLIYEKAVSL